MKHVLEFNPSREQDADPEGGNQRRTQGAGTRGGPRASKFFLRSGNCQSKCPNGSVLREKTSILRPFCATCIENCGAIRQLSGSGPLTSKSGTFQTKLCLLGGIWGKMVSELWGTSFKKGCEAASNSDPSIGSRLERC